MSIDKINSWLTLVANLGVLVGIIFLAFELQQNTNISRSGEYRENVQEINNWRALLASDPELTRIFSDYMQGDIDELSGNDQSRLYQLVQTLLGIYDNAYFSYQLGIMGESEWARFRRGTCDHVSRMETLNINFSRWLTDDFSSYIDEACR